MSKLLEDTLQNEIKVYKSAMHFNGISSCMSSLLSIYLILYHSIPQMKTYKFYLLNIVFWSTLFDTYLGLFYTPGLVLPAIVVCSHGLFHTFDSFKSKQFQFAFFIFLLGAMGVSVASAFIYRLAEITNSTWRLHNKFSMTIMVTLHFVYTLPPCIYGFYLNDDYPAIVEDKFPAIYNFTLTQTCIFVSPKVNFISWIMFGLFSVLLVAIAGATYVSLSVLIIRKMNTYKVNMSSATLSLNRDFTCCLIVQALIPSLSIVIPLLILLTFLITNQLNSAYVRITCLMVWVFASSHSTLNCLSMVVLIKPFREAILRKFCGRLISIKSNKTTVIYIA